MNTIWIFRDGLIKIECVSFPYAFRVMYNAIRKGLEKDKRSMEDMTKKMSIVSPIKDNYGRSKIYSYNKAMAMATNQGLLKDDGELNSREFKKRY
jgi:hypothetical protein